MSLLRKCCCNGSGTYEVPTELELEITMSSNSVGTFYRISPEVWDFSQRSIVVALDAPSTLYRYVYGSLPGYRSISGYCKKRMVDAIWGGYPGSYSANDQYCQDPSLPSCCPSILGARPSFPADYSVGGVTFRIRNLQAGWADHLRFKVEVNCNATNFMGSEILFQPQYRQYIGGPRDGEVERLNDVGLADWWNCMDQQPGYSGVLPYQGVNTPIEQVSASWHGRDSSYLFQHYGSASSEICSFTPYNTSLTLPMIDELGSIPSQHRFYVGLHSQLAQEWRASDNSYFWKIYRIKPPTHMLVTVTLEWQP